MVSEEVDRLIDECTAIRDEREAKPRWRALRRASLGRAYRAKLSELQAQQAAERAAGGKGNNSDWHIEQRPDRAR